jgi:predicted 2-oxoglutarate/Fe(II)-dependent dioxygenase YbiX
VPHIVIKNALQNFDQVKKEILDNAHDTHRAQRGGPNGHSVKWFTALDLPITSEVMGSIAKKHISSFNNNINIDFSDVLFEYQLIEYNTPNDQYNWHIDGAIATDGSKSRRMTLGLNLTTNNVDFTGDGFQLSTVTGFIDNENEARVLATNCASALSTNQVAALSLKNSMILFNPDTIHRASPITSGKRQLLTVWVIW